MVVKTIKLVRLTLVTVIFMAYAVSSDAITLLTNDEAVAYMFPRADEIVKETKHLSDAQKEDLKKRLDGKLINHRAGDWKTIENRVDYTFYFAMKLGKKTAAAVILEEPGKFGPIRYIVSIAPDGKVENLAVMKYMETRGRPIARRTFLQQFIGIGTGDSLVLRKDVTAISGATYSSQATVFCVRKALNLYDIFFMPGERQ